ncbi:MAG: hypothetical protein AAF357_11710, partial [Verrucomicrobiota bacterium]
LSEDQYGDFELTFEVKVHDKLNSGCQIRSREKTEADLAISGKDGKPAKDLNRFWGLRLSLSLHRASPLTFTAKRQVADGSLKSHRTKSIPMIT